MRYTVLKQNKKRKRKLRSDEASDYEEEKHATIVNAMSAIFSFKGVCKIIRTFDGEELWEKRKNKGLEDSFYEYVSENGERLTDTQFEEMLYDKAERN